jgi:hypothetical protein
MHGPINFKSPNNTSKWQIGFNSAFKGLRRITTLMVETRQVSENWNIDLTMTQLIAADVSVITCAEKA